MGEYFLRYFSDKNGVKMLKDRTFKASRMLFVCGLLCFLISLMLPTFQIKLFNEPYVAPDAYAMIVSFFWGYESFVDVFFQHRFEKSVGFILGFASISNLVFLISPVMLFFRSLRRKVLWWFNIVSILGLVFGLMSPFVVEGVILLIGYYIWLTGHGFLIGSLSLGLTILKKQEAMQKL